MAPRSFPVLAGLSYPVKRTPTWSTDVQQAVSGKRTALGRWSYPIYAIEVGYEFLRSSTAWLEYQELLAFYNLCGGRAQVFRFTDPDDNSVTNQAFGAGDGLTTAFQLYRGFQGFASTWTDPVFWPTAATIMVNGNPAILGTDYTLSSYGVVTFTNPPASGAVLTWTGTFDWLCRFGEDSSTFEKFAFNLWQNSSIKFETEKI